MKKVTSTLKKRDPIAFDLCTNRLYKTKVVQNKKKKLDRKFNWKKELDGAGWKEHSTSPFHLTSKERCAIMV